MNVALVTDAAKVIGAVVVRKLAGRLDALVLTDGDGDGLGTVAENPKPKTRTGIAEVVDGGLKARLGGSSRE